MNNLEILEAMVKRARELYVERATHKERTAYDYAQATGRRLPAARAAYRSARREWMEIFDQEMRKVGEDAAACWRCGGTAASEPGPCINPLCGRPKPAFGLTPPPDYDPELDGSPRLPRGDDGLLL